MLHRARNCRSCPTKCPESKSDRNKSDQADAEREASLGHGDVFGYFTESNECSAERVQLFGGLNAPLHVEERELKWTDVLQYRGGEGSSLLVGGEARLDAVCGHDIVDEASREVLERFWSEEAGRVVTRGCGSEENSRGAICQDEISVADACCCVVERVLHVGEWDTDTNEVAVVERQREFVGRYVLNVVHECTEAIGSRCCLNPLGASIRLLGAVWMGGAD